MDGLTDTQLRVVRFLKDFYRENGFYATIRDVQEHMGWASHTTAYDCLLALTDKGFVERKRLTRDKIVFVAAAK